MCNFVALLLHNLISTIINYQTIRTKTYKYELLLFQTNTSPFAGIVSCRGYGGL